MAFKSAEICVHFVLNVKLGVDRYTVVLPLTYPTDIDVSYGHLISLIRKYGVTLKCINEPVWFR